jgi:ubiquinone/menaquinone biosynthesis C-methylase UbiE
MELVEAHFREIARVLKPGGDLVILNFAYRDNVEADRLDVARLAAANGLRIVRNGTSDFRLWDGVSFVLKFS